MTHPSTGSPTSSVFASGDDRIDALLKDRKWGGPQGTGTELTYSFPDSGSVWLDSYSEPNNTGYRGLDATERQYFAKALDAWAEVANIKVTEVADGPDDVGDIRVAFSDSVADSGLTGWAYLPNSSARAGDVWLNPDIAFSKDPAPGGSAYSAFLHEIGHALGLAHPFGGGMTVLSGEEDSNKYTVMAYDNYEGQYAQTPMLYDILAIQYMYGANYDTRADDTIYTFSNTSDTLTTIWDGGGVDTFNASNQTLPVDISLTEGTFSSIGPGRYIGTVGTENVAIAFGVVIENAIGGSGNDTLTGNAVGNFLAGVLGNDSVLGLEGDDTLYGGNGDDTLVGGAGDDLINGGDGEDLVVFSDTLAQYAVSFDAGDRAIVGFTGPGGAGDGTDVISGVEWFRFDGQTLGFQDLVDVFTATPPSNHAPDAVDDTTATGEDQSVAIDVLANDGDADGDPLVVASVTQGGFGQVSLETDGTVAYTPNADFHGSDSFTYTVSDGEGGTSSGTVTVTVLPVNDAPVAADDAASTTQGQSVTFSPLDNDADVDGDPLQVVGVSGAGGGDVVINGDGSVTYTPNPGFSGIDTMRYTVRDPAGGAATATIAVEVAPSEPNGGDTTEENTETATVSGTDGNDRLSGTASDDVVDGGDGNDILEGRAGNDVVRGSTGNDKIWGDYKGNNGAPGGDDALYGGDGDDSMLGQKGNDTISGGDGDDTLKGQAGDDWLHGGAGDDSLIGGGGGDRFVFAPGFGNDTICDFGKGADTIDLSAFAIGGFTTIDDDGDGRIETGEGGDVFSVFVGSDTVLDFGGGNILTIQGASELRADDFDW
jgi:serralysin